MREIREVNAVRIVFRLKTECTAGTIQSPMLPFMDWEKVCGIKLNPRKIRADLHTAACNGGFCDGDFLETACACTGNKTVVIAAGKAELIPIRFNLRADWLWASKVKRCFRHGQNPACR